MDELFIYNPLAAGTKGLVYIGEKLLVYRRDDKTILYPLHIDLPGGGPEHKETPFETFQREVAEEFSLNISPQEIVYVRCYPSSISKGKVAYFVVAKLPAHAEGQIKFGDEGKEYFVMSPEEYLAHNDAWPVFQERTVDYLKSF
jgi:8-oxo-dGTP diphosphatase